MTFSLKGAIQCQGYPVIERMRPMNQRLNTLVVTSLLLLLSGCGLIASSDPSNESPTPAAAIEPSPQIPTPSADIAPEEEVVDTPVPNNVQVYQDDSGMFALALPEGYTYESTEQGIRFVSSDEGFAGEVVYQSDANATSNLYALEENLKEIIEDRFGAVDWEHNGQRQPDGSVRLAWEAEDENGRAIDALSFIEVHGQNRFALMLYGVDKVYNDYSDDARIIAGTYVVRQGPAIANTDNTDPETETNTETEADAGADSNTES